MKVIYTDPDGRAGTYHPKLGWLESGKSFELSAEVAGQYISSGLLEKALAVPAKAGAQKDTKTKTEEVKTNGNSIDR